MTIPTQAEVGTVYDLLLATRDGTTLPCRNKDGQIVNLSQVAFMCSIDLKNQQHEETELQHKDQLVQLASSNLIDREFDQWPQVTQGDWSGGGLQRVLTGSTPLTSFGPQSDPTRYWDGDAILWPIFDYLPQRAAVFPPVQDAGGATMKGVFNAGTPAGSINSIGQCFAYLYENNANTHSFLVIQHELTRNFIQDPAGIASGSGTPAAPQPPNDFFIGAGVIWYSVFNAGNVEIRFVTVGGPTVTLFDTITGANFFGANVMSVGYVGSKVYLAFPYFNNASPTFRIRLYDITLGVATAFTELNLSDNTTVLGASQGLSMTQTDFQGSALIYSFTNGLDGFLASFDITTSTTTILARFPAEPIIRFAVATGSIFCVTGDGNMYLAQGGNVQHIGPLPLQAGTASVSPNNQSISHPLAFGPYAIFAINTLTPGVANGSILIYAYDVLRGRLFRMVNLGANYFSSSLLLGGSRIGLLRRPLRAVAAVNYQPQWGVVVPTLSLSGNALDVTNAQEAYVAVTPVAVPSSPLQNGLQIISSIIDFTSAQPKLFRQLVANFTALGAVAGLVVTLDAWLDQDPAGLNAVPDFTTSINGGTSAGATTLKLQVNKIGTKVVYRITITGGDVLSGGVLVSAPKLVSVIVRAATGWTRTMFLTLADNAMTNDKAAGSTAWSRQQPPGQPSLDGAAAYNFGRQLWRLKGGEVTATFPNGDAPADWLLQDIHWDSPKPFGPSFRADERQSLAYICQIKLREDL